MKTNQHNYQPEDIEALLAEKSFRELYEEEKRFVLEHLSSPQEYEQMRETLLSIRGAAGEDQSSGTLHTPPRVKEELMAAFEKERKKRAVLWWNSVSLGFRNMLRLDLPVMRLALGTVVLLLGVWIVFRFTATKNQSQPELAKQENIKPQPDQPVTNFVAPSVDSQPQQVTVQPGKDETPQVTYTPQQIEVPQQSPQPAPVVNNTSQDSANHLQQPVVNEYNVNSSGWRQDTSAASIVYSGATNSSGYPIPGNKIDSGNGTFLTVSPVIASDAVTNCSGTTIPLTVSGGTAYSWSPASGNLNSSGYSVNGVVTNGTYTIITSSHPLSLDAAAIGLFYQLK